MGNWYRVLTLGDNNKKLAFLKKKMARALAEIQAEQKTLAVEEKKTVGASKKNSAHKSANLEEAILH